MYPWQYPINSKVKVRQKFKGKSGTEMEQKWEKIQRQKWDRNSAKVGQKFKGKSGTKIQQKWDKIGRAHV